MDTKSEILSMIRSQYSDVQRRAQAINAWFPNGTGEKTEATPSTSLTTFRIALVGNSFRRNVSVHAGDNVIFRRDASNRYDKNAIEVHTAANTMAGFVPRTAAAILAPLIDKNKITLSGAIVLPENSSSMDRKRIMLEASFQWLANPEVPVDTLMILHSLKSH